MIDCKYEKLYQVSITFVIENNTTPHVPPVAKIQFTDVNTKEIYTDLVTLYEINLNRITGSDEQNLPKIGQLRLLKTHLEKAQLLTS